MCKIAVMTGINSTNKELAWKFIKAISKPMSFVNNDGLGYAAVTADGELFGERWLSNKDAFEKRESMTAEQRELLEQFGEVLSFDEVSDYNKFGSLRDDPVAIILHTRMATTPKGMMNTHPFVVDNTALIHNGVIRNAEEIGLKQSTCDSEAILNLYMKHRVCENPKNIQAVAKKLAGHYACGVITKTPVGHWVVDVFKDTSARLSAVMIKELGMVFTTDPLDATGVARELGLTVDKIMSFNAGHIVRIDAITGKPISHSKFDCSGKSYSYEGYNYNQSRSFNKKSKGQLEVVKDLERKGWVQHDDGSWYKKDMA